ncbi:germinal-center associated nuclear protein [Palaemon carinicauda]|uniref:germinal-center associated nuclear protein n=1 Tax=Palaemon carinicauda TaxID=392227 RepID=UPI0035B691F0
MADEEGQNAEKPTFTNPFLLPSSSSGARQTTTASESSGKQRPLGAVTSRAFTPTGNIFPGSSTTFSTSSSKLSVASTPSTAFQSPSFKPFESGASFSNVPPRSGGMFGADSGLFKSGMYTFPVFGGEKKGSSGDGGFSKASAEPGHEIATSGKAVSSNLGFGAYSSGFDSTSKAGTMSKSVPLVFGERSSNTGMPSTIPVGENVTSVSSPAVNVFGGLPGSGVGKSEIGKKPNVFGGAPNPSIFQSSLSGNMGNPGSASSSAFTLFRGSGSASETKSVMSAAGVPPIFGGTSSSASCITSLSGYNAAPLPSIFGGKVEGTKRGSVVTSTPNVFGSITGSTACFTSVSSSNPRLFGGIPSVAITSIPSRVSTVPFVTSATTASNLGAATASNLDVDVGASPASAMVFKLPSTTSETLATSPATFPETSPAPSIFGGQTTSVTGSMPTTTLNEPSSKVPESTLASNSSASKDQSTPSGVFKAFEGTSKDKSSSFKSVFTPSTNVFGGIKSSKETESSSELLHDHKMDSPKFTPAFGSTEMSNESGMASVKPEITIMDSAQEEENTYSEQPEPGEIELEPGEIAPEPEEVDPSLIESQNQTSVTETGSSDVDKGKQLDDLLGILQKEDPKLTPTTAPCPPQYEKKDLTKIIIAQIPDSCMDKDIIKTHFQKFGTVKRVFLNQKSNQATVQYQDHKGASRAKRKGQKIHPNLPEVKIFYGTPVRRRSEDGGSNDAMLSKRKAIKTLQQTHPSSDSKLAGDLDPYVPLERPSTRGQSSQAVPNVFVPGKFSKVYKKSPEEKKKVKTPSRLSTEFRPRTMSPQATPRIGSPKTTRLESPKPAKLKLEEKLKAMSRPVSPAREHDVFAETKNLKAVLELQALTSNDRHTVLKARDKLMRNERKKRLDIKKAANLDAGCPDMCPEFERYMRDVQNDLSSYEVTNGALDHKLVVKKFSRSSADKEEPLPHELRPGPVLLKTMDFLVCNIMVLCDKASTDIGIWYNYLWDRTRAIRSDITQQQLTDGVAVTIIERCVRFHIYADVHLCQESPDVFDRKLNTENLTKSLQTLKELYKDLAELNKNFPSESEFRAYEMLLNLNDGEKIVHQYSQYRDEVQKSSDVIFALKVFLALKSNNFVKFFKLIRSGTYLQGCILHRYFPQVRSKALDIFVKAYAISKRVSIPLSYIIKTLGFEDKNDAVGYLNYHGITVDRENVMLDKNLFYLHPEGQPPVTRPTRLIESNRLFSVVEVIQGGPMPENPLHTYVPHDSFDKDGYLNPDARDASDQQKKLKSLISGPVVPRDQALALGDEETPPADTPQEPILESSQPVTHEAEGMSDHDYMTFIKDAYSMITSSVVSELSVDVAKKAIKSVTKEKLQKLVSKDILLECIKEEVKKVAKSSHDEVSLEIRERERKEIEKAEKKRRELEELQRRASVLLCNEYIAEFLPRLVKQVCQESVGEVERELELKVHAALMKELPASLVSEVVHDEALKVATIVTLEMERELEEKVEKLQQKIRLRKVKEYFRKWKKVVIRIRRRKQAQVTFPASASQLDIYEQNKAFSWGYKRKLSENVSAENLLKRKLAFTETSAKMLIRNDLMKSVAWYPLPIVREMRKEIERVSLSDNILKHYFKVLICNCSNSEFTVLHWLRSKLSCMEDADVEKKLEFTSSFYSKLTGQEYAFVFLEVSPNALSKDVFKGTSAVLFVTQGLTTQDPAYASVKCWIKENKDVPYKVISEGGSFGEDCWELNEEEILIPETSERLMNVILDLWNRHAGRIQVSMSRLNSLVLGFAATYYIQPSVLKQQERSFDGKSPLGPMTYVDLYNSAVQFLVEVFADDDLSRLDWPPPELSHLDQILPPSWNNEDMGHIRNIIKQLKLPVLQVDGFMPWEQIVRTLYAYVGQVSQPESLSHVLWSQINSLLTKTLEFLKSLFNLEFMSPDTEVNILHIPWTEIINACVSYKLGILPDIPVYYQATKLRSFDFPKGWWEACDYSDPTWNDISYGKQSSRKRKDEEDVNPKNAKIPSLSTELLSDIIKEKEKYIEFQRRLEDALEEHDLSIEDFEEGTQLESDDPGSEEDPDPNEEVIQYSELSSSIAKEKEKCELFQKKLESILGDGEDLRFLFKQ